MYKKVTLLTACVAATALCSRSVRLRRPTRAGATASAADMPEICKAQAAKRSLTGSEADEYLKKCAAPIGDAERSAAPSERLEGQL